MSNYGHLAVVEDERVPEAIAIDAITGDETVPTQIANPVRTTTRTIFQSALTHLILLVPIVNLSLISLQGYLVEQDSITIPAWVYVAVNAGIAVTTFVIGLVARLMAVPGVADLIQRRLPWLAPVPEAK